MAEKFISLRNLQFLLYEQFDAAAMLFVPGSGIPFSRHPARFLL